MTTDTYTNGQTVIDLEDIPVRDVWRNEARDFTPWLAENISRLSIEINMELTVLECEKSVGPFSADIYAEDEHGDKVVIENQLERTDHDHIGKMITYAAGLNAQTMIWIADKVRPEHAKAIDWLNEMDTTVKFYLIELLAQRIDDTNVTVDFRVVCEPNDATEAIKISNKDSNTRKQSNIDFWTGLTNIDGYNGIGRETSNKLEYNFIEMQIPGRTKMPWEYRIRNKSNVSHLYFYEERKDVYLSLLSHKKDIEHDFGEPLIWTTNGKNSQITSNSDMGGLDDKDEWEKIQHDMIDRMLRLQNAIGKYLE